MKNSSVNLRLILAMAVILAAAFILTPRFFEPGGEAWKQWAAARIMRETGGFPVFSLGPGYVVYLQAFQFFKYPASVFTEYFITHIFVYTALFLMLSSYIPFVLALLLTCVWIPNLAVLEPGGLVAGIGFIALYLKAGERSALNNGYLPPSLLAAVLCHSAYLLFLAGNIIGLAAERYLAGKKILDFSDYFKRTKVFSAGARAILIAVMLAAFLFSSHRSDNNQMLSDPAYVPVPLNNPLAVAFFHVGNWKYAMRTVPEKLQIYQDWYLTHDIAFSGAKSILEAAMRRPDTVFLNIADSFVYLLRVPMRFFTGNFQGVLSKPLAIFFTAVSLILMPIGFIGMFGRFKDEKHISVVCSVALGSAAIAGAFLLTWCIPRYVMTLLPIGIMTVVSIGRGLAGPNQINKPGYIHVNTLVILVSAALVLFTAVYPEGRLEQVKAVLENKGLLSGEKPVSMVDTHSVLLSSLDNNPDVLALEDVWIKAFAKVDIDKVHSVYALPPFPDLSGKTEKALERLQVIWVSSGWSKQAPSISTQSFLRYHLHVAPFLKKALANGWTVEDVKGYGKIYKRPETIAR